MRRLLDDQPDFFAVSKQAAGEDLAAAPAQEQFGKLLHQPDQRAQQQVDNTDDQVQLLSRYTKNVVLLFDADVAGIQASMRSIEILLKRDMEVKIVSLPKGEDPDSYVNKYGKEEFEELIKRAENFLEYESKYYESQGKFDDPSTAAEAIRELVKPVALINDELKRNLLIRNIAKKFNLREKLIETELDKQIKQVKRFEKTDARVIQNKRAEETPSTHAG